MLAPVCELLFLENSYKPITGNVLFIGRQDIFLTPATLYLLLRKYNVPPLQKSYIEMSKTRPSFITDKSLMSFLPIDNLVFMDVSDYEGADIIWDLGYPVNESLHGKFDFIFNGSCLDNMFNPGVAMVSLSKMLTPHGRILHLEHATPFNGPYVMFPPSWFHDYYVQNGFADCKCYVGEFEDTEDLYYGPWQLYFYDYASNPNGAMPRGKNFMLVTLAENSPTATTDKQPIQAQYRSDTNVAARYNENLEVITTSKRILYPFARTSDLFKGEYPSLEVEKLSES